MEVFDLCEEFVDIVSDCFVGKERLPISCVVEAKIKGFFSSH